MPMDDIDILVNNILEPELEIPKPKKPIAGKRVKRSQPRVKLINEGDPLVTLPPQESVSEERLGRVATRSRERYRLGLVFTSKFLPSSFGYDYETAHRFIYSVVSYFVGRDISIHPRGVTINVYPEATTDSIRVIASSPRLDKGFDQYAEGAEILLHRLTPHEEEEIMRRFRGPYG
jgi:hypothetical protein